MADNHFVPIVKNFQRVGAVLLIIAATLLVYAPAVRNGFVWDDTALVQRDPLIRSWRLIPEGFCHFLFVDATASNFYRPMQRLVFTANYAAFAFRPAGWHLVSVLIHAAAAVALYLFLRKWWGEEKAKWALGAAMLWAIHPLHTSAVTYVSGLADPLAALFGFGGLYFGLRSLEGKRWATLMAALCFLAAMLSKESGAMALAVWVIFLVARRVEGRVWAAWSAILVAILGIYCGLRFSASKTPPPEITQHSSASDRAVFAARAVAEYSGLMVAPINLHMERDVRVRSETETLAKWRHAQAWVGLAIIGGSVLAFFVLRRRAPEAAVALVAAAVAYLPVSNVFPLNATVAEHWLYIPSAWLFAAVTVALFKASRKPAILRATCALLFLWGAGLGLRTWLRQDDWRDQRTFFTRTIADGGDSARMHLNLGNIEAAEGHAAAALDQYRMALDRGTAGDFPWLAMASLYLRAKQYAEAREALLHCREDGAFKAEILQLRGALDYSEKQIDPTPLYGEAASLLPLNWTFERRYVDALAASRGPVFALRELQRFMAAQSFRADSWQRLGELFAQVGQGQIAAVATREALDRDIHLKE